VLLARDVNGKPLHRWRRWTFATCTSKSRSEQWRSSGWLAVLQLADDTLGNVAHGINGADHLLLANHDIVKRAFELRRDARVNQCRIGLLEDAKQFLSGIGRDDILSLRD
jgi:hypothetical protein